MRGDYQTFSCLLFEVSQASDIQDEDITPLFTKMYEHTICSSAKLQIFCEILERNKAFNTNRQKKQRKSEVEIGQEVNVSHKRQLPPTLTFTDLPHHRTCRSTYGGFVLLHLTVCGKLFSAIPLSNVTSILLSDSVLSSWIESSFRTSDEEVRRVAFIYYCTARFGPSLQAHVPWVL